MDSLSMAQLAIIQVIVVLAGAVFFLLLYTRYLKKQITQLKQGIDPSAGKKSGSGSMPNTADVSSLDTSRITGEIGELRKMLDEKLLLTANMRKLTEALELQPDSPDVLAQQKSTLHHLEEYINHSRKEAGAVEERVDQYKEQLKKAKRIIEQAKSK